MICKSCSEEYDSAMFSRCPYCLCENTDLEAEQPEVREKSNEESVCLGKEEEQPDSEESDFINEASKKDIDIVDIPLLSMRSKNALRRNGLFKLSELEEFLISNKLSSLNYLGKESEAEIIAAVIFMKNQEGVTAFFGESSNPDSKVRLRIEDVFCENTFNLFVRYCKEKQLVFVDELKGFDFQSLSDIKGMGAGKIEAIIKKYEVVSGDSVNSIHADNSRALFEDINSQLYDMSVDVMVLLGISAKTIHALKKSGYATLQQLVGIGRNRFSEVVGKRNIEKFEEIAEQLSIPMQ